MKRLKKSKVTKRLKALGAVLIRSRNHLVWKMPDGARIVVGKTTSDTRAEKNALAHITRWERGQGKAH